MQSFKKNNIIFFVFTLQEKAFLQKTKFPICPTSYISHALIAILSVITKYQASKINLEQNKRNASGFSDLMFVIELIDQISFQIFEMD